MFTYHLFDIGQNLIDVDLTKDPSFFLSTPQTEATAISADLSNDENQDEQLIASSLVSHLCMYCYSELVTLVYVLSSIVIMCCSLVDI